MCVYVYVFFVYVCVCVKAWVHTRGLSKACGRLSVCRGALARPMRAPVLTACVCACACACVHLC